MRILCGISGIDFTVEHFPGHLTARETYHPVFNIPQKKLISHVGKWASGELTDTDSYLLFLAILHSTELVQFRVPATKTPFTASIIANNMEHLVKAVSKMNAVMNPSVVFPQYVITPETKNLSNVRYWIQNWQDAWQEFQDGYRSAHESQKLIKREQALERLIKSPHKTISQYSSQVADWAAVAGSFPTFLITSPFTQLQIPVSEYWSQIIGRCANETTLFSIPRNDLEELIEHCEENIPVGTIQAELLFRILRHARERQKNFLGLGDLDIGKYTGKNYQLLDSSDSNVEAANLSAAIQAAPDHEPKLEEYPTKLAYMKAKFRWDMAKKYGSGKE